MIGTSKRPHLTSVCLQSKNKLVSVSSYLDSAVNDWTFRKHLHSVGLQLSILPHVCSVPIKAAVNKQHLATFPDQDRGTEDCRRTCQHWSGTELASI